MLSLSRREREIMDVVYRRQRVSCADVLEELNSPPSYSAVRAMLNKLVEKDQLDYAAEGKKYVYFPRIPKEQVSEGAARRLVQTFFGGSVSGAIVALLNDESQSLDADQIREIEQILKEKRQQRKQKRQ